MMGVFLVSAENRTKTTRTRGSRTWDISPNDTNPRTAERSPGVTPELSPCTRSDNATA